MREKERASSQHPKYKMSRKLEKNIEDNSCGGCFFYNPHFLKEYSKRRCVSYHERSRSPCPLDIGSYGSNYKLLASTQEKQ